MVLYLYSVPPILPTICCVDNYVLSSDEVETWIDERYVVKFKSSRVREKWLISINYLQSHTLHQKVHFTHILTFITSILRKLSRPITQPIFIQHSTLTLNNASKVNQSSCNSILCKPYLFARAGDWGGQVVLSSALWGEGGWVAQPDNISPSLLFKSPMCRKASYLLNGLSGFIKGKSI